MRNLSRVKEQIVVLDTNFIIKSFEKDFRTVYEKVFHWQLIFDRSCMEEKKKKNNRPQSRGLI